LALGGRQAGDNGARQPVKTHDPVPAVQLKRIYAKDFGEPPNCFAPEQIHLEEPVTGGYKTESMKGVGGVLGGNARNSQVVEIDMYLGA
jgi:hypothetical protein